MGRRGDAMFPDGRDLLKGLGLPKAAMNRLPLIAVGRSVAIDNCLVMCHIFLSRQQGRGTMFLAAAFGKTNWNRYIQHCNGF